MSEETNKTDTVDEMVKELDTFPQPATEPEPIKPDSLPESNTTEPPSASQQTKRKSTKKTVQQAPEIKFLPRQKHYVTSPDEEFEIIMSETGLGASKPCTVLQMFYDIVRQYPNQIALREGLVDGTVIDYTYQQYWDNCWQAAKAMRKLGFGVFRTICIIGFNTSEWLIACLASMMAGGMCAGVYTTNSPDACSYVASDCKAQLFFVEDDDQLKKVLSIRNTLPELKAIIQYKGELQREEPNLFTWAQFMELGKRAVPMNATETSGAESNPEPSVTAETQKQIPDKELNEDPKSKELGLKVDESGFDVDDRVLKEIVDSITPNRCCLIIYTSGTTGFPKGVMLCHDNLTFTIFGLKDFFPYFTVCNEHTVSYLPLSHIAAQIADIYLPISVAATVHFARKDALKGSLGETLRSVRPTYFFGVPRVWEKFEERMRSVLSQSKGAKAKISSWSLNKGLTGNTNRQNNKDVPFGWFFADKLVFKKIRAVVGLDRCKLQITGAAPIARTTLEFFMSIDIPLYELYGMSESTGVQVSNVPKLNSWRSGSVGKPYDSIEMKIDQPDNDGNGEIITRGRHVFMGYLGLHDKTKSSIDQHGFLHSEDIGTVDEQGFYYITGRIKEILITAGGENIPPVPLENEIKAQLPKFISNVMVIGNSRRFLSALITMQLLMDDNSGAPTEEFSPLAKQALSDIGCNVDKVVEVLDQTKEVYNIVLKHIQDGINRANDRASSNAQKIIKWTLLDTDFSIPGGELGPTMKLKRGFVEEKYKITIESFYEDTAPPPPVAAAEK